ncbi:hypothetical protein IGI65_002295 [Enterococcus sp. DIV0755b]|uniref:MucBP domain-containing protein n=1 Tax=Enterococcus sp. DIV0755b TaxID=2774657 RepID=UPI003F285FA2
MKIFNKMNGLKRIFTIGVSCGIILNVFAPAFVVRADSQSTQTAQETSIATDSLASQKESDLNSTVEEARIWIPNETVRQAINKALKRTIDINTYSPTKSELASIKGDFRLDFKDPVDSLEGIQYLTGISSLYTTNTKILNEEELSKIGELTQLTYLSMGNSNLTSIAFVKNLTNLTGMVLPNNAVRDVSFSHDFYYSNNRKQYNFQSQQIEETIETTQTSNVTIPELKVIGVNNNQVSFEGFAINSSNNPNHVENNFIIDNLKPGEVKKFTYRFADRSINHAGAFSGTVTITVKNTLEEAMPLTVKYQDVNGNQIAEDQVINGYIGDSYDVSTEKYNLKIDGYTLKEVQGSLNGILAETPQTVTYIYEKNATKAKDVVVHYQDANGSKIADDQFFSGNVNAPYDVSTKEYQLEISGYTLEKVVGSVTGFLSEEEQNVTYVYERAEGQPVTVNYEDEEGNSLSPSEILNGKIGLPYETTAKTIAGWVLKTTPENAQGVFSEEEQNVTYVYERAEGQPVTVNYEDEEGNSLSPSEILNGKIGLSYEAAAKTIAGWVLKTTPENAQGVFSEEEQNVTYVYSKLSDNEKNDDDSATIGKDKIPVNQAETPKNKGKTITKKNKTTVSKDKSSLTADKLPKTGEIMNHSGVIIGLLVIIVVFFIAVIKHTRKK